MSDTLQQMKYKKFEKLVRNHEKRLRNSLVIKDTDELLWLENASIDASEKDACTLRYRALARANLNHCEIKYADFSGSTFIGAQIVNCRLCSVDLGGCCLTDVNFRQTRFERVDFTNASLMDTLFSGATLVDCSGLPLAPYIHNIDKEILKAIGKRGQELDMGDWHRCETTHCRAGWAIHLAGAEGYALEHKFGPSVAGALIYAKSREGIPVPDWYVSTEDALADLRECASKYSG